MDGLTRRARASALQSAAPRGSGGTPVQRSDAAGEAPDPLDEIAGLETETILADLEVVEQRVERLRKDRSDARELALLERLA